MGQSHRENPGKKENKPWDVEQVEWGVHRWGKGAVWQYTG